MKSDFEKAEMYRRQLGGMTAAHNRAKNRAKLLEELAADALSLMSVWDYVNWESLPKEMQGDCYIPEGNFSALLRRADKLGVKVRRKS